MVLWLCGSLVVCLCGFYKNVVVVTNFSWNLPTTACLGDSNVLSAPRQPLDAAALDLSTIGFGQTAAKKLEACHLAIVGKKNDSPPPKSIQLILHYLMLIRIALQLAPESVH